MIHKVGLIHRGNEAQIPFAYQLYADPDSGIVPFVKNEGAEDLEALITPDSPAGTFKSTFSRDVKVHFIGAWDTVSSIGVVRARKLLPHTIDGMNHVCFFRHALALDERRVKFLPEYVNGGLGPQKKQLSTKFPHTKEVWFAGTHSDVGGGNEENPHLDRTRPSLRWMFSEASAAGLHFDLFRRKFDDVDAIRVGQESLTFVWRSFEHLPFRRLTYDEGRDDRQWWDNRWIVIEIVAYFLWKLFEVVPPLFWLLWKLVGVVFILVTSVWMALRADWRALRSLWRRGGDQRETERQPATDTTSWPPHRGKGRIIRKGQKIHTSVWRSQNLGGAVQARPLHRTVCHFVLSCFRRHPQKSLNYTPSARLLSRPKFWDEIRQLNGPSSDVVSLKTSPSLEIWKELDLYDSVEDLINKCMSHSKIDPDDDTQRIELTMINIHATSRNGYRALLDELGKSLDSHSSEINSSILCRVLRVMLTGSRVHSAKVLQLHSYREVRTQMLRHLRQANEEELRTADEFLTQSTDFQLKVLTGHKSSVFSVAFSPDGRHIASGSVDRTIRTWDAETGLAVGEPFKGHDERVFSVAFSPNGKHVVSGSDDNTIRIWDVETGKPVGKPFEGHSDSVWSVAYSPNGERIVSGSGDETIRIWDAKMGQTVREPLKGHAGAVYSVAYSPDGTRIVSGSSDKTVRIWNAETGQMVGHPLEGHTFWVSSVAFSPDGKRIVSGSYDATIRIWEVESGEMVGEPLKGHSVPVTSVAFSPTGKHIVSGSYDKAVRIWDVETRQMVGKPYEGHINWVNSVMFSPDGKRVVSGSRDSTIRIWDVSEPLQPLVPETEVQEKAEAGPSIAVSSPANPSTIP